jgi:hypothetical protein
MHSRAQVAVPGKEKFKRQELYTKTEDLGLIGQSMFQI